MKYKVEIPFTVRKTPEEVKAQFPKAKDWEVIDWDEMRHGFVDSEQAGLDLVHDYFYEVLGYSSSFEITKLGEES